jgi:glutamate racemase
VSWVVIVGQNIGLKTPLSKVNCMSAFFQSPIGLFDSGVGGLTVMREVVRQLPHENMIYLGDTARLPYGSKSPQAVLRYTLDGVSFLLERKIKLLIIACFTASSHAMEALEQKLSIPVIGVIQSGFEELMARTRSKKVAILGTASTIKSGVLQSLILERSPSATIFPIACPLLAPLIEEGLSDHPATQLIIRHYLAPLHAENVDSVLLACTHYPLIRSAIQEILGPRVQLIEPAQRSALEAKERLASHGLLNLDKRAPSYEFYATDDPAKFHRLTNQFFGPEIKEVKEFKA